jgi:signal transduction histidine kinase
MPRTPMFDKGEIREFPTELTYGVVPYVALVISIALSFVIGSDTPRYVGVVLGLSAAAAVWLIVMRVPYEEREEHPVRGSIFYVVHLAFVITLILINPFFAVFGFTGYLFVMYVPGRWKLVGMTVNAGIMAVSEVGGQNQLHGLNWLTYAGLFAVNTFIVTMMTKTAMDDERRDERRARTIDELSEANRRLEQMMEENAGLHAQLVVQAREAGMLDERQRMAGEIHDTLAQGLTGILAQLEAAELARDDAARRGRHLGLAKELARESLAEARRSVQALRPQRLEEARLPDALRELSTQWTRTSGVPVRVEVDGEAAPLQPALEVVLFRAAQEALANIAKHAQATRAGMTLTYMHDQVSLDLLDDGKGFDPRCPRTEAEESERMDGSGYGLAAMRRRLRQVGGGLEIESAPGDGTTVSASVPALYRGAGEEPGAAVELATVVEPAAVVERPGPAESAEPAASIEPAEPTTSSVPVSPAEPEIRHPTEEMSER